MKIYNFAYGSNMLLRKLQVNVPSAVKITNAFLQGYRFDFNKLSKDGSAKGNITKTDSDKDKAWGVVYEIEMQEKKALDKEEGLGKGYNEGRLIVTTEKENSIEVLAYIADEGAVQKNLLPYDWYRDMVIIGAVENSIEKSYITFLKEFAYTVDPDHERRKKKFSIVIS